MSYFLANLLFIFVAVIIVISKRNGRGRQKMITINPKLIEITNLFHFLYIQKESKNSLLVNPSSNCFDAKITADNSAVTIHVTGYSPVNNTPINETITLSPQVTLPEIEQSINRQFDKYLTGFRLLSGDKSMTYMDYLRYEMANDDIIEYCSEAAYLLSSLKKSIQQDEKEVSFTDDSFTILDNYTALCDAIIRKKSALTMLIPYELIDKDEEYKPLINVLEYIYKTADWAIKHHPDTKEALLQINQTSFVERYSREVLKR